MELFLFVFLWLVASGGPHNYVVFPLLLWLVASGAGFSSKFPAIPINVPMASGLRRFFFSEVTNYSYAYSCRVIPMGIPMSNGVRMVFPQRYQLFVYVFQ